MMAVRGARGTGRRCIIREEQERAEVVLMHVGVLAHGVEGGGEERLVGEIAGSPILLFLFCL